MFLYTAATIWCFSWLEFNVISELYLPTFYLSLWLHYISLFLGMFIYIANHPK